VFRQLTDAERQQKRHDRKKKLDERTQKRDDKREARRCRTPGEHIEAGLRWWTAVVASVVVVASACFGISSPGDWTNRLGVAAAAGGLFTAAIAVGAVFGFLFGLPRHRFVEQEGKSSEARSESHFLANSNLLKVSDWLTTILIGLGLVQLANAGPAIADLSQSLREPLGGMTYAGVSAVATMIGVSIVAVIMTYLWTSTRVRELFEKAEDEADALNRAAGAALPVLLHEYVSEARGAAGHSVSEDAFAEMEDEIIAVARHADRRVVEQLEKDLRADHEPAHAVRRKRALQLLASVD
jgi:hypothetical protein